MCHYSLSLKLYSAVLGDARINAADANRRSNRRASHPLSLPQLQLEDMTPII